MPLSHMITLFMISALLFITAPMPATGAQTETPDFSNESCLTCHADVKQYLDNSAHSQLTCMACHPNINSDHLLGYREYLDKPEDSLISPLQVPETCGACHKEELDSYLESVHGRGLLLGSIETANCIDCHGSHNAIDRASPESTVASINLPETCGKCHVEDRDNYARGTEHKSLAQGTGVAENYTFKFFVWLTILTVIGLILHMEVELLYLLKRARRPKA